MSAYASKWESRTGKERVALLKQEDNMPRAGHDVRCIYASGLWMELPARIRLNLSITWDREASS